MEIRVAINGFGRIGRQLARLIFSDPLLPIRLVAVNSLEDINTCAFLLQHDSCHGKFSQNIAIEGNRLLVGDHPPVTFHNNLDPSKLPWKNEIDIVIECSGKFTNSENIRGHLTAGAKKIIITAAAASVSNVTLCYGVNQDAYDPDTHHVISASSCTTNCIAPILHVITTHFGFVSGMATFLHSYTSSQPLLDTASKDLRRSRSAATNITPTTTSAEEQVPIIIPATKNRFKAIAIRIPSPVIHLADLTVQFPQKIQKADLLAAFAAERKGALQKIISVSDKPLVSTDYIGSNFSAIIDSETLKAYGNMAKMLIWHDNEHAYSKRVLDLASYIGLQE